MLNKFKNFYRKISIENNILRKFSFRYSKLYKKFKIFDSLNLDKKSIFIDIGANEGLITHYINDKYKCQIECYEPHPGCYSYLKKKFINMSNIKIYNEAVSNKNVKKQKIFLHKCSKNKMDLHWAQGTSLEKDKLNVDEKKYFFQKTVSISKILNKYEFIDVIKIDIETHEYKILPTIFLNMHKIGKIYCELNGRTKYKYLKPKYDFWIKKLKKNKYYGTQFIEWS